MKIRGDLLWLLLTITAIVLVAVFAPIEKTLGVNARLVYLHGAWVWVALFLFLAAGVVGAAGFVFRKSGLHSWSRAIGRTALFFWVTFLPQSLFVMQANWNGLFLEEPRFRIPLNYAIVSLLLQVGVSLFAVQWSSLVNIVFGVVLFAGMSGVQTVLHPDSPVFTSGSLNIKLFFAALLVLLSLAGLQAARFARQLDQKIKLR